MKNSKLTGNLPVRFAFSRPRSAFVLFFVFFFGAEGGAILGGNFLLFVPSQMVVRVLRPFLLMFL